MSYILWYNVPMCAHQKMVQKLIQERINCDNTRSYQLREVVTSN